MNLIDSVNIALQSIKGNTTRTIITASIIAIGLTALIGILTAISAVENKMTSAFSSMGAHSFTIKNRGLGIRIGNSGSDPKVYPPISYKNAMDFKNSFQFRTPVSVSVYVSNGASAKYLSQKTNPNIGIQGIDELGLSAQGLNLVQGRNFSLNEIENGNNVCLIGNEIYTKLFKDDKNALDKIIHIGNFRLKVIGVLEASGSSMGFSGDRAIYIPLLKAKSALTSNPSYSIVVLCKNSFEQAAAISEATSQFRLARKLKIDQENNFEITKSDAIAQTLMQQMAMFITFGIVVGLITIIGAAIGLMNIMLVSVTERTREIGVRKAMGATPAVIRKQFLIEATVICLIGGIFGILFGIGIGNIISFSMGGTFIIPWLYILIGLTLCILVGIISGYYPAKKASKLDPIDALRYE